MKTEIKDICNYLDFLIGRLNLYITLHGDFVAVPELIRYNFHLNPYCSYIKTSCGGWNICIEKQQRIIERCKSGDFFGTCHAGVGEYIYPVYSENKPVGFISVSGYVGKEEKLAVSKALHFAKKNNISGDKLLKIRNSSLSAEIPEKSELDAIMRPLVFMISNYIENESRYLQTNGDFYSEIVRYVTSNHNSRLTMKILSRKFNCSVSTLSHLFKKHAGMSISEYIENLRLDEAKWLLKQSAYTVTEISDNLGFCNSAYFSTVFKKKYGVSPKEFSRN